MVMERVAEVVWRICCSASLEFVDCDRLFRVYLPISEGDDVMWMICADAVEAELVKLGYLTQRDWEGGWCEFVKVKK
jgi:hypothetical protein